MIKQHDFRAYALISGALILLSPTSVAAQRTQENAVTSAGDAFGKAVGNERVGLYTVDDIRGFNPIDAGNGRIEGLYFDQQERPTPRLINSNTIRVGITAQGYPFPAPTGIVDYRLRAPGKAPSASYEIERSSNGGAAVALDTSLPLANGKFGLTAGIILRKFVMPQGNDATVRAYGTSLVWHPGPDASVTFFGSGIDSQGDEAAPVLFPAGPFLPPQIQRGRFAGQKWAQRFSRSSLYGVVAKLPVGAVRLELGLFRSQRLVDIAYADLLRGVRADGNVANRQISADGNNVDDSVSGELRLARDWTAGSLHHRVTATLRGRAKDRVFGGARTLISAPSRVAAIVIARPMLVLGEDDRDKVRQLTYGIAYGLDWASHGSVNLAISKSRYRKTATFANAALGQQKTADDPLLYSAGGSILLSKRLALYGGIVRGLEESLVAPEIASNRGEAPPAIITRQFDAGLRYALTPDLSLVAGVFSVRKPYYNLDQALRFGQLGTVENKGFELSLAGKLAPGLSLIAGTALIDPKITGQAVTIRAIGSRPVGSIRRRSVLNLDWTPLGQKAVSIDVAIESLSARIGNSKNDLVAPARATVALGGRYRFALGKTPILLRAQVTNIFNEYGWLVSSSGGFTYSPGRTLLTQLIIDL
jgi:iron complex outermembrane recepter protein